MRAAGDPELEDLRAELREQRRRRVERDDPTGVDDRDAVAEALGLVEVVRGDEHRHLGSPPQPGDSVEELGADQRVEPDRRLVEEEHPRARHERAGDLEPPPFAAAVRADGPVDELGEVERRGELVDPRLRLALVDAPQAGVDLEVPPSGERAVDDGFLEHDAARAPRRKRVLRDVETGDLGRPARRRDGRRQHADRRGLARAVRPEQSEDLARLDVEVDPADRLDAAGVDLPELAYFDHLVLLSHPWCSARQMG